MADGKTETHRLLDALRARSTPNASTPNAQFFANVEHEGPLDGGGYQISSAWWTILWSPSTGAHELHSEILDRYRSLGAERGLCGFPISDEVAWPSGARSLFQRAAIYWSPEMGAHEVYGAIRDRYEAIRGPGGHLAFPVTDERPIDPNR
jgi:uncharacterized protein with LGFP repeats